MCSLFLSNIHVVQEILKARNQNNWSIPFHDTSNLIKGTIKHRPSTHIFQTYLLEICPFVTHCWTWNCKSFLFSVCLMLFDVVNRNWFNTSEATINVMICFYFALCVLNGKNRNMTAVVIFSWHSYVTTDKKKACNECLTLKVCERKWGLIWKENYSEEPFVGIHN